jgi:hypothetical protein
MWLITEDGEEVSTMKPLAIVGVKIEYDGLRRALGRASAIGEEHLG